mmetsp:Transcript_29014/g.42130  ORF Transcript_29014/g.42130 Transcript_29014/m.42130 type:complete len:277 (-) Transcript_29014:696-1526(-)
MTQMLLLLFLLACLSSRTLSFVILPSSSIHNKDGVVKYNPEKTASFRQSSYNHHHRQPSFSFALSSANNNSDNNREENNETKMLSDVGEYDRSSGVRPKREVNVGDPQKLVIEKEMSVTSILKELAAIQAQGPQKYCVLGTRHCSFLHQQIIELLAYALVLSGNHVYTSGASGTNAAAIRGAIRAERPDLLTVVLPQSLNKQTKESQELLKDVTDLVTMPQNDDMSLDVASRICNSYLLSQTDQLISFAFHESQTVIEASKEAQKLDMLVTTLYLD